MIALTQQTDTVKVALSGTVSTSQMRILASWRDYTATSYLPGRNVITTNNLTDMIVVPAPLIGQQREVQYLCIYNNDTLPQTLTVKFDANAVQYILWAGVLNSGERLEYIAGTGFKVSTNNGAVKTQQSTASAASNTLNRLVLTTDVINSNVTANTLADVTGLAFPVLPGSTYYFRAAIPYTSAIATTGSRWTINGPSSPIALTILSRYTLTATTETVNYGNAYSFPATANASSLTVGNMAALEGTIVPSAAGTVTIQFASEISASAITAKAGALLEYIQLI